MAQEMKYETWFLHHSGMKEKTFTKGGFLSKMKAQLNTASTQPPESQKPKEKPEEKPKEKKEEKPKDSSPYANWFYKNCDNNNLPDLSEIKSHDYPSWFNRHATKRAPEPKYSSPYEAWFFRNCDNRNLPTVSKADAHDYSTWFKKHATKKAPCTCDKSYAAWFERNCDSKNPGIMPIPVLTYEQWFDKHCTPPTAGVKCECTKHEPYNEWFKKHSSEVKQ